MGRRLVDAGPGDLGQWSDQERRPCEKCHLFCDLRVLAGEML